VLLLSVDILERKMSFASPVIVKQNATPARKGQRNNAQSGGGVGKSASVGYEGFGDPQSPRSVAMRDAASSEINKAREASSPPYPEMNYWTYGYGATRWEYGKLGLWGLLSSTFLTFFTLMLRGYVGGAVTFGLGVFLLRTGFTIYTYSELKGLLDFYLVCGGMWAGRIHWRFGLVLLFCSVAGTATGAGFVHAFNPTGGFVNNDGAPQLYPMWSGYQGLGMMWEFFGSFSGYMVVLLGYGYLKMYCAWKKHYQGKAKSAALGTPEHYKMLAKMGARSASKWGMGLAVGAVYGVVSVVGYSITGSGLDFFSFLWPAIYSGLLVNYPPWWIYLAGPSIGIFSACFFYSIAVRIMNWGFQAKFQRYTDFLNKYEAI